jgi:hypothetical protein
MGMSPADRKDCPLICCVSTEKIRKHDVAMCLLFIMAHIRYLSNDYIRHALLSDTGPCLTMFSCIPSLRYQHRVCRGIYMIPFNIDYYYAIIILL